MVKTIGEMLKHDGIYVIAGRRGFFFVEVEGSVCHQLKPTDYSRDGLLRREGWDERKIVEIHGPFGWPNPPIAAIGKIVEANMAQAVENGANSVSMPDELVEVAAWLARRVA